MMIYGEALNHLDTGIRQDRARLLSFADSLYFQPKYKDSLDEIEGVKQKLRDIPELPDYPNIDYPIPVPDYFPQYGLVSITKDETLEKLTRGEKDTRN